MKEIEAPFIYKVVTTNITQAYTKLTFLFFPYYVVKLSTFSLFYFYFHNHMWSTKQDIPSNSTFYLINVFQQFLYGGGSW